MNMESTCEMIMSDGRKCGKEGVAVYNWHPNPLCYCNHHAKTIEDRRNNGGCGLLLGGITSLKSE